MITPISAAARKEAGSAKGIYQSNAPGKRLRKTFCTTYVA
jgi:hypothetical protein